MKDVLLLLMTPNMSLRKWDSLGQLKRELQLYDNLCKEANLKLVIFSYGRDDEKFIINYPQFKVIGMPSWIPKRIPFKLQNLIFHISALFIYRRYFKRAALSKTNQFAAVYFGLLLKFFYRIPLVIRMGFYHSHFKSLNRFQQYKESLSFNFCDKILVTSSAAAKFIISKYNVDSKKVLSMCNSIDLQLFKPLMVPKKYDIIFVGRLEAVKNIDLLMQVISTPKLETLIIGHGTLNNVVIKHVNKFSNITWKEKVDNNELPGYYNQSKAFLLLSHHEGNPKALLEAMACGIPCIGTDAPGIRDCISHDVNGILVSRNADNIKKQVLELTTNTDKAKIIAENAYKWVNSECNMHFNIIKEAAFYSSLLN